MYSGILDEISCIPAEDRTGVDKLLAKARFGSISGPLKFVTLRASCLYLAVPF